MVTSEFLSLKYTNKPFREILRDDPGRIAAQAITGIGFLGAGVILRYKETIRSFNVLPISQAYRSRSVYAYTAYLQ